MPKDSKKIIDIFLEVPPRLDKKAISKAMAVGQEIEPLILKKEQNNSELDDLEDKLKPCFTSPHVCPYSNMRVHWTDLREYWVAKSLQLSEDLDLLQVLRAILPDKWLGYRIKLGPDFKYLLDAKSAFIYIRNNLILKGKISKQWETVAKEYLDVFLDNMKNDFESDTRYKHFFRILQENAFIEADGTVSIPKNTLADVLDMTFPLLNWYTDAYTIGRFLRTFENNMEIKNAIMFNGGNHTEKMKNFLIKIGFKLEQSYLSTYTNQQNYNLCLDVNGLTEPYF
jgi:hypothetical protein